MLPKKLRIGNSIRTLMILKKGRALRGRFFFLRYLLTRSQESRFAMIVSKKISKQAVLRNLARRRAYEAIRLSLPSLPKTCYDIVVLVQPSLLQAPFPEIVSAFEDSFKKLPTP